MVWFDGFFPVCAGHFCCLIFFQALEGSNIEDYGQSANEYGPIYMPLALETKMEPVSAKYDEHYPSSEIREGVESVTLKEYSVLSCVVA